MSATHKKKPKNILLLCPDDPLRTKMMMERRKLWRKEKKAEKENSLSFYWIFPHRIKGPPNVFSPKFTE
jgi:hypothetical protein